MNTSLSYEATVEEYEKIQVCILTMNACKPNQESLKKSKLQALFIFHQIQSESFPFNFAYVNKFPLC